MILFPPCKINLGLSVLNKREDNYHNIETIMYQLPICDILEIVKSDDFSFHSTGLEIKGKIENNLCYKAFQIFKEKFEIGNVSIHLHKLIPMGAGLGGGSSDGTYTMKLLNNLFKLGLSENEIRTLSLQLGSDCPLFVGEECQFASGRGEILEKTTFKLNDVYIQVVNLGIHVSTKEAFENINYSPKKQNIQIIIQKPLDEWKNELVNDFEAGVFENHPELAKLKLKMYENGAIYVSMTGSGSTIFAIYTKKPERLHLENETKVFEKIIYID